MKERVGSVSCPATEDSLTEWQTCLHWRLGVDFLLWTRWLRESFSDLRFQIQVKSTCHSNIKVHCYVCKRWEWQQTGIQNTHIHISTTILWKQKCTLISTHQGCRPVTCSQSDLNPVLGMLKCSVLGFASKSGNYGFILPIYNRWIQCSVFASIACKRFLLSLACFCCPSPKAFLEGPLHYVVM